MTVYAIHSLGTRVQLEIIHWGKRALSTFSSELIHSIIVVIGKITQHIGHLDSYINNAYTLYDHSIKKNYSLHRGAMQRIEEGCKK